MGWSSASDAGGVTAHAGRPRLPSPNSHSFSGPPATVADTGGTSGPKTTARIY